MKNYIKETLYQAYVFDGGKRVAVPNVYVSKQGVVYREYEKVKRLRGKTLPIPKCNTDKKLNYDYINCVLYNNPIDTRKVEEIMCATFDCDENTPYEYTNGLKRYIYLDDNAHNCSLDNMKSCDFWEYVNWAHNNGMHVHYTKENRQQIYDRLQQEGIGVYAFSEKYNIPRSALYSILSGFNKTKIVPSPPPEEALYQAYVFNDGERVQVPNLLVTSKGKAYTCNSVYGYIRKTRLSANMQWCYIDTRVFGRKKIEEIMCATFFCHDDSRPTMYECGAIRFMYIDGNTHNYSADNMVHCDFLDYLKWAQDNNVRVIYTEYNKLQLYNRYLKEDITIVDFAKRYHINKQVMWRIIKSQRGGRH